VRVELHNGADGWVLVGWPQDMTVYTARAMLRPIRVVHAMVLLDVQYLVVRHKFRSRMASMCGGYVCWSKKAHRRPVQTVTCGACQAVIAAHRLMRDGGRESIDELMAFWGDRVLSRLDPGQLTGVTTNLSKFLEDLMSRGVS
jgi:hypothetical protein